MSERDDDDVRIDPAAIVVVATHLFAERGFDNVSIQDIADEAGLSADDVARTFANRENILIAALEQRDHDDGDRTQILQRPGGLDLLRSLAAMVWANTAHRDMSALLTQAAAGAASAQHPAHHWARQRYQWSRALFSGAFRRDIQAGLIAEHVDPDVLACQVIAMMDGLQMQWLIDPDAVDMAAMIDHFADGVMSAIRR